MRIGIQSAQLGPLADPAAVRSIAVAAEQLGYASIWVVDRQHALDPVALLGTLAAATRRIRIGSGVLAAPWYRPALLARSLASLDVLSEGRLEVGLGVPAGEPGDPLDAVLDILDHEWAAADLRPVQRPRPPVLLAGDAPEGLDRVARRADGWIPAGLPVAALAPLWGDVRDRAAGHGRDPEHLRLVVRATVALTERALGTDRPPYHGTIEQVVEDVEATRRAGAHEVVLGLARPVGVDEVLDTCARIAEGVGPVPAP